MEKLFKKGNKKQEAELEKLLYVLSAIWVIMWIVLLPILFIGLFILY